jgi:hypothetical protein
MQEAQKERNECAELLQCELNDQDILGYSRDMAGMQQTKNELEEKKKEVTKEFGLKISRAENNMAELANKIRTRKEIRNVNCYWEYDWTEGEKILVRKDTAEVIRRETITASERQRHMDFAEEENEKAVEAAEQGALESTEETEGGAGQDETGEEEDVTEVADEVPADMVGDEGPEETPTEEGGQDLSEPCEDCGAADGEPCVEGCISEGEVKTEGSLEEKIEKEAESEGGDPAGEIQPPAYKCAQCGEFFDEPEETEDDETRCPHEGCKSSNWM